MACGQCSSGGCGSVTAILNTGKTNHKNVAGCSSGGCSTGCTKLNSFDWLSDMEIPGSMRFDVVEVKFKGGRKEYLRNNAKLDLYTGDFVVCDTGSGYTIGSVSLQGELVRLQMIKKGVKNNDELLKILRVANEKDLEKHQQAINRDLPTMYRVRELIKQFKLEMKLSDVEFQSDNTKATFYYSAEDRVDFRELIKALAGEFRIRVEMKQISLRQEASRIGGIGSCGRELCCSTWLTDFKSIPTAAARYQNLSLNPAKLSGQCGRLKCCLNYELETYVDALQHIPKVGNFLQTEKGDAYLQKTDIFRRIMWFSYKNDINWVAIPCDQVVEIMELNGKGKKPASLEELSLKEEISVKESLNNDLDKLDRRLSGNNPAKKKKKNRNNRNKNQEANGNVTAKPENQKPAPKPAEVEAAAAPAKPANHRNKKRRNNNRRKPNE